MLKRRVQIFFIVFSYILWLILFKDFFLGHITINIDTNAHYAFVKYFFNNLLNGIFPLWEPYVYLGRPNIRFFTSGVFNPFLFIIPALIQLGFDYYSAYLFFLGFYYFIGLVGFYLLSKKLLENDFYALLAYLLMLFSGIGAMLFNQIYIVLLFVPAVWFFYFLVRFSRSFAVNDFLCLIFCGVIISVSYLPFYFITVFLIFLFVMTFVYFVKLKQFTANFLKFCYRHWLIVVFSIGILSVSCIPIILYKINFANQEVISGSRYKCDVEIDETCIKTDQIDREEIFYRGTLGERMHLKYLFAHVNTNDYESDSFFYIPVFCFIVIALSFFIHLDKLSICLLVFALLQYLIALGAGTPLYEFLYDRVAYFQYYRNLFFFMAYLLPTIIIYSMLQLKNLISCFENAHQKKDFYYYAFVFGHLLFLFFLFYVGNITLSTFLTVLLSLLFFVLYKNGVFKKSFERMIVFLFLVIFIQPMEVFAHYSENAKLFQYRLPSNHVIPEFKFTRPDKFSISEETDFKYFWKYIYFWNLMALEDSPGEIIKEADSAMYEPYLSSQRIDRSVLKEYVSHKFLFYDSTNLYQSYSNRFEELENVLRNNKNVAMINDKDFLFNSDTFLTGQAQIITENSDQFSVVLFNPNEIWLKSNFGTDKFLVYNDSYSKFWKASLNNKDHKIGSVNGGFKGMFLPRGQNILKMRFSPPGGVGVYAVILFCIWLWFFICLIRMIFKPNQSGVVDYGVKHNEIFRMAALKCYLVVSLFVLVVVDHSLLARLHTHHLELTLSDAREAIKCYELYIETYPDEEKGYIELAKAYQDVGQYDKANRALNVLGQIGVRQ